jgi:hypothetical protein
MNDDIFLTNSMQQNPTHILTSYFKSILRVSLETNIREINQ